MSSDSALAGLSPEQAQALARVLDEIIPARPDARAPAAGELGLVAAIEEEIRRSPDLRPAVVLGLGALDERARGEGADGFTALAQEARRRVLDEVAALQPAFLPGLVFHTYVAYYQHDVVLEALGLEARPPYPKGYEMEPFDETLLESVRKRPKLYRDC